LKNWSGSGRFWIRRPDILRRRTVAMELAEQLLLVRTRDGKPAPLKANAAQAEFERRRGPAQHRAQGAADGADHLGGGAVFLEDHHPLPAR
jgi:hypothetical protein